MHISDDVSQIPGSRPSYVSAAKNRQERLTLTLHERLDAVIDQESHPELPDPERKRLASLHKQIREDLASIRYGASESTVKDLETRYSTSGLQAGHYL